MQNPTGNETKKCKRLERDKEEGAGRGLGPWPGEWRGEQVGSGAAAQTPVHRPGSGNPRGVPGGSPFSSSRWGFRHLSFYRNWSRSEELPDLVPVIWREACPTKERKQGIL